MGLTVFISFATSDLDIFNISTVVKRLETYPEIDKVLYWMEDADESIIEFMEKSISSCDIFILFCSPNALESEMVKVEWQAALSENKKIVPVFKTTVDIPKLIKPRRGVEFLEHDFTGTIESIYKLALKKTKQIRKIQEKRSLEEYEALYVCDTHKKLQVIIAKCGCDKIMIPVFRCFKCKAEKTLLKYCHDTPMRFVLRVRKINRKKPPKMEYLAIHQCQNCYREADFDTQCSCKNSMTFTYKCDDCKFYNTELFAYCSVDQDIPMSLSLTFEKTPQNPNTLVVQLAKSKKKRPKK